MRFLYNICLALNCLLLFLVFFGANMQLPVWLQVGGRMHPLLVHFPIVLLLFAVVWELLVNGGMQPIYRQTGDFLLLGSALTAALSALAGLFLSREGGYEAEVLATHQWSGAGVSLAAFVWYSFRINLRRWLLAPWFAGLGSAAMLLYAGHHGAVLTHGENYLWAPAAQAKAPPVVSLEEAQVFEHLVRPILEAKCMNCHNDGKAKGELSMETQTRLLKGGKNGLLWDTSDVQLGLLMRRVHLPADEKEHMPPKGKPQLDDEEMQILYHWIRGGARFDQKVADLSPQDKLRALAEARLRTAETETYDFKAADEATIRQLNNEYRTVHPLALNSPALGAEFFGPFAFKSEHLAELQSVKNQLVHLNLNRMPVQDADLKTIAQFTNLRKLNLAGTQISGAGLAALTALKQLQKLALSGTAVKASDLEPLRNMPALSTLYLWNTGVSEAELAVLRQQLPKAQVEGGFKGDTVVAKLNAPVIEGEEQLFTGSIKVFLKNYIRGAAVRYTLDGTTPDSLQSPDSKGDSITIDKTCVLTARAFMPGWVSSEVATKNFYKTGLSPDSVLLVQQPNPQYGGVGPKTLINKKIGDTDFRNNKWLGFRETRLESYLFFQQPVTLSSVTLSTLVDIGSYILPAKQVEIWGGPDKNKLTLLKRLIPEQPKAVGQPGYRIGLQCDFAPHRVSVLKVVAQPVAPLPAWHPGKGERAWVFIDEIFFN